MHRFATVEIMHAAQQMFIQKQTDYTQSITNQQDYSHSKNMYPHPKML